MTVSRERCNASMACLLCMDGSLREDSHLILVEGVIQVSGVILSCDRGEKATLNNKVKFRGTGMNVRCIKATRTEEADGDSSALPNKSRKCCVISPNSLSTITLGNASDAVGIGEVKNEVVVLEKSLAFDGIRCENELLEEGQTIGSGGRCRSDNASSGCRGCYGRSWNACAVIRRVF